MKINQALEIIQYAIDNNIAVSEASEKFGFHKTYVKNVKMRILDKYENEEPDEVFDKFIGAYEKYESSRGSVDTNTNSTQNIQMLDSKAKTQYTEKNGVIDIEWKAGKNYPVDHIKTLDQLLDACDVDKELWSVKDYQVNKWDVTMKDGGQGFPETFQNFQVKARLEKNLSKQDAYSAIELFREMTENYTPPVLNVDLRNNDSEENNLLEINIFDLHIGKLSWAGETGENYDVKIASYRFMNALTNLLKRASGFSYNRILFPIGNDFFNSDNLQNTTTAGTPQDEDLRWQKTISLGNRLIVEGIDLLKLVGLPIDVMVIPGNHDFERSYHLGEFISAWYRDDEQVNVDNGASPRKYYRFGEVLLGFTHGKEEKETSLPMLMAGEAKEDWGKTSFHEWHLGHEHRKRQNKYVVLDKGKVVNEDLGVTVRYMSSLTGTEEWHHKKGYVGQAKAADAFIWNDETGLIGHLNTNIVDLDRNH